MINEEYTKKYCCEDISLIENYDKAISDIKQTWECHHKGEILPCGRFTVDDLNKFGLYYKRPAAELIFLTKRDHNRIHWTNNKINQSRIQSEDEKIKRSKSLIGHIGYWRGKKLSTQAIAKKSQNMLGRNKGKHFWNNGVICKFQTICPGPEWKKGRL